MKEKDVTWKQIQDYVLERHILVEAQSMSFSTSQPSNHAERHKLAAFSKLYERELRDLARAEAKVDSLAFEIPGRRGLGLLIRASAPTGGQSVGRRPKCPAGGA